MKIDEDTATIEAILLEAKNETKSEDPIVHILWLIQGLASGNFTLEQTQRYAASQLVRGFIPKDKAFDWIEKEIIGENEIAISEDFNVHFMLRSKNSVRDEQRSRLSSLRGKA